MWSCDFFSSYSTLWIPGLCDVKRVNQLYTCKYIHSQYPLQRSIAFHPLNHKNLNSNVIAFFYCAGKKTYILHIFVLLYFMNDSGNWMIKVERNISNYLQFENIRCETCTRRRSLHKTGNNNAFVTKN